MTKKSKMPTELLILLMLSSVFNKDIDDILDALKAENEISYEDFKALIEDNDIRGLLDDYKILKK